MFSSQTQADERVNSWYRWARDDRTQPWFAEVMSDLEGTREIVLGQALRCESYYSAPQ